MAASQSYCMSTASGIYKNALTQVNDLATKHHLPIWFFDSQEHGPVDQRTYSITIKVGTLCAVGQAHTKKEARARAATNILEPLKEMCLDLKPCGYLSQVAEANRWEYPEYVLLESRRLPWGWLFSMRVSIQEVVAIGTGPNKTAAKNNAAAKMLETLGFECPKYNPLIDKKDVSTTPQVNQVNEEQEEEEEVIENKTLWSLDPETCLDQDRQDICTSPDVITEEIIDYLDEESVPCETEPVLDPISLSEILLEIKTGSEEQGLCETKDQETGPKTSPTSEMDETENLSKNEIFSEPAATSGSVLISLKDSSPEAETKQEVISEDSPFEACTPNGPPEVLGSDQGHTSEQGQGICMTPEAVIKECKTSPSTDQLNISEDSTGPELSGLVLPNNHQANPENKKNKDTHDCSKKQELAQDFKEDLKPCGYLFQVAEANRWEHPEYVLLESRRLPWGWLFSMRVSIQVVVAVGTGPNKKAAKNNAAAKMLEILGFECPKYNPLIDKKDVSTTPQVNQVNEEQEEEEEVIENKMLWSLDPETCLDQDRQDICTSPDVITKEIIDYLDEESVPCETEPVLDTISLSEILLEIEEIENKTFCSLDPKTCLDQDRHDICTSPDVITEEIIDYLDEESVPCVTEHVLDTISLSQILFEIETGSEEQGLCETIDQQTGPETETCQITEMSEADIFSQKEPTHPPKILDGPPVACFLIRALVRKLVQKSVVKPEDQGEVVQLLLEKTKEKILNQDVPIAIKNMRAVGKAAAKDLLNNFKLQGVQLSAEDEAFQEAMVKHLNNRLNNFLFGPKKKGLSRLCSAVGKFFCVR